MLVKIKENKNKDIIKAQMFLNLTKGSQFM